jgi:Rod binding domain-containing protein
MNELNVVASLPPPPRTPQQIKTRAAAEDFEAMVIAQMFSYMTTGMKTDGPFSGGYSEGIYRSMLNEQYGKIIAKRGGIGIADAITREMLRAQENIQAQESIRAQENAATEQDQTVAKANPTQEKAP